MCTKNQRAAMLTLVALTVLLLDTPAHASLFQGETLDAVANVMAWMVLVIVPAVAISVFWLLHILPEKIAYKKNHPQAPAIHTLCLLSLFFGGMLWPIAWLWAYSKPVLYNMAYGTDEVAHPGHGDAAHPVPDDGEIEEVERLRKRLAELEGKLAATSTAEGARA